MQEIKFFVGGIPAPKGSMRAFIPKGWKRPILTSTSGKKLKEWENAIRLTALANRIPNKDFHLREIEISLYLYFLMPKPKKPRFDVPLTYPDIDKLARGAIDALTGTLIKDDKYILGLTVSKSYPDNGEMTGCGFKIQYYDED